nr:MAG TPA: hypothetical protein [Caudoviricetes sp.]
MRMDDCYYLITIYANDCYIGRMEASEDEIVGYLAKIVQMYKALSKERHLLYCIGVAKLGKRGIYLRHLVDYIIIKGETFAIIKDENGEGHIKRIGGI